MRHLKRAAIVSVSAVSAFVACTLVSVARGQEVQQVAPLGAARKVSEYVNLFNSCNAGAHLDNFAIELQNNPQAEGYIIAYAPVGESGAYGRRLLDVTKNYLVQTRGLEESRLKTVYGGRYKNLREAATELWLVPYGAPPPPVAKYRSELKPFEGKFAEYVGWDGYDDGESWSNSGEVALTGFADLLRQRRETVAYVVAYNFPGSAIGTWRRVASREAGSLEAEGVEQDRVKIIFGGKLKKEGEDGTDGPDIAKVQLWLLPRDAPPPVREAAKERRPKEAQRLGTMPHYILGSEDERRAFEGLAEVLREDEDLRACLILRLPSGGGMTEPGEPPEIDMTELAEQWKKELKAKYRISENRVIVMAVPPPNEWSFGEMETWVVPPGAAPPDPFAAEGEVEPGGENQEEF